MHDDNKLIRIETKLDKIAEDINEIKIIQEKQHVSLEYHIRRTDILEGQVKPVTEFRVMALGAVKLVSAIAVGVGIVEGIIALLEFLKHA